MLSRLIPLIILASTLVCCTRQEKPEIAKNRKFFFTITSPSANDTDLIDYLVSNMENKRIAITNQSGTTWPFYEILPSDYSLPIDSLIPPHHFVHLLERADQTINLGEYFMEIRVMIETDTIPNYDMIIYQMDKSGLKVSTKTGFQYADYSVQFDSLPSKEILLKSILRHSFK